MMDSENCGQLVEATLPLTCYQILIPIWVGLQANIHKIKDKGLDNIQYRVILYKRSKGRFANRVFRMPQLLALGLFSST